jgi:hypothetical protein
MNGHNTTIINNAIEGFDRVNSRWMKHPNGGVFLTRQGDKRDLYAKVSSHMFAKVCMPVFCSILESIGSISGYPIC